MKNILSFFLLSLILYTAPVFANDNKTAYLKALENPASKQLVDDYIATLPKVKLPDIVGGGERYVVEGDRMMTARDIGFYLLANKRIYEANKAVSEKETASPKLIIHKDGNRPAYWAKIKDRKLTYAVLKTTFPNEKKYNQIVREMTAAANNWEKVCKNCKIDYKHISSMDGLTTADEVFTALDTGKLKFVVIYTNSGNFLASAFFPSDPPRKRIVQIDKSYFTVKSFNKVGILRHELGHTLGYRHEHTRGVPGCNFEDNQWYPLTPYDPQSVMHYLCGNRGNKNLDITRYDIRGHRNVYATPCSARLKDKELNDQNLVDQAYCRLEQHLTPSKGRVDVSIKEGESVKLGSLVTFQVSSKTAGNLIVVDIKQSGEVVQLFPNKFRNNYKVDNGSEISLPNKAKGDKFQFRATEAGSGKVVALVVPDEFPSSRLTKSPDRLSRGFSVEAAPASYLMELVQLISASIEGSGPEQKGWAFAAMDYEIK